MRLRSTLDSIGRLFGAAAVAWQRDNVPRLGAALAYYTLFSLAPLLIIVIAVTGLAFGEQAAEGQIVGQLRGLLGNSGAEAVQQMIEHSRKPEAGAFATLAALLTLFLGASGAFGELKSALNVVWHVDQPPGPGGILGLVRSRLLSFAMVLAVAFLLLVSLVVSAVAAATDGMLSPLLGSKLPLHFLDNALSFVTITVLFALLYKHLPDTPIGWQDVWVGAALTSGLFSVGKRVIGLYLGRSSFASVYGAAGSVIVLIVWVYYAAQIFFFGAEITRVYAGRHGSRSEGTPAVPA